LEYIVVDGASTDGSVEMIKRFAGQDQRMHWLSEPDQGQSDAINKGLRLATGDVVAFLNSDDLYYPGTLQTIAQTFAHPDAQWAYGRCRIINAADQEIAKPVTWYKNMVGYIYQYWVLLIVNYVSQPAVFWRRDLLTTIGYLNTAEHLVMDYELWCRFGQRYPGTPIRRYLAGFRLYATSKSGRGYVQQFQQEYAVAKRYTHNWFILWLHQVHSALIVLVYKVIR
ncbi:MAG: glycosyltransferase, partial [Candidatus Kerfeldbacteria bacterium]|nr:glycosyltransferase [Candidatus Kerfeldbacteria bacterium]